MKFNKSKYLFFWLLCPFVSGIILAGFFCDSNVYFYTKCILSCCFFAFMLLKVIENKMPQNYFSWVSGLLIQVVFLFLGVWIWHFHRSENQKMFFRNYEADYYIAQIISIPKVKSTSVEYILEVKQIIKDEKKYPVKGKLLQRVYLGDSPAIKFRYGDQLRIAAHTIQKIPISLNIHVFDYHKYMYNQGVQFIHNCQISDVQFVAHNRGNFLIINALKVREKFKNQYAKIIKDTVVLGVVNALMLGDKSNLDEKVLQDFRNTGTIHVLVISGMHVAYIYLFLTFLFKRLPAKSAVKFLKNIFIIAVLLFYTLLTGFSASVIRAFIMICIYMLANEFNRKANAYHVWSFTAFIMLLFEPNWLFQLGFQLSFLAVLGILFMFQPFSKIFTVARIPKVITDIIAVSLSAQIFVLPLIIYYFHTFPLNFILSNLWVVLPVMLLMILGVLILMIPCIIFLRLFAVLVHILIDVLHYISNFNILIIKDLYPNVFATTILLFFLLMMAMAIKYRSQMYLFLMCLCFGILVFYHQFKKYKLQCQQLMVVFSLKNHYAIAFIQGFETVILSDLESTDQDFAFQVSPLLANSAVKIRSIDSIGTNIRFKKLVIENNSISFNGLKYAILNKISSDIDLNVNGYFLYHFPTYRALPNFTGLQKIFILGGNFPYQVKHYKNEIDKAHLHYFDMRNHAAFIETIK